MLIRLNSAELAAVLAGLRAWQAVSEELIISSPRRAAIRAIARDSGRELTPDEIDALIERINVAREEETPEEVKESDGDYRP